MNQDYRNTIFEITLSDRRYTLYKVSVFYKGHLIKEVDTKQTIQEILLQAIEYFGSQGASLDELVELFQTNVPLKFNIEDALPYDSTLKELVENGGIGSKQYFPNGIN